MAAPSTPRFTVPQAPSVDLIEFMWWLYDDRGFGADDLLDVLDKPTKYTDLYCDYRVQA